MSKKKQTTLGAMNFVTSIGINFVVCIGLCVFIGQKADVYFHSSPIGTIIGIVLGFITAVYSTYKKLMEFNED